MKTWTEAKNDYVKDHLSKPLKAPNIRFKSLENIETALIEKNKNLLNDKTFFKRYNENSLRDYYLKFKGKQLNSAEKSVIHGLFKFSI
jgi:hypothetical protein